MAAAQFVEVPGYAALVLRRTFADLALPGALIHRSREWWDGSRARWDGSGHKWTFPSGAIIQFGYAENDGDERRYQSSEFHAILIDEASEFSPTAYRYLFSRLRRRVDSTIPARFRGGTNPGGPGHEFLKERFAIGRWEAERLVDGRRFIRATRRDNPHVDQAGYAISLAQLDPVTRDQLDLGDWNTYTGGRFRPEWLSWTYRRHGSGYQVGRHVYLPTDIHDIFLTVDTATTVKEHVKDDPDWTVLSAWALTPGGELLWLACERYRIEMPDIPAKVYAMYGRWNAGRVYVEGGGPQKGVVQLHRRYGAPHVMNVVEVLPKGDKLEQAANILNVAQAGRLWLPDPSHDRETASFGQMRFPIEEVRAELLRFTGDEKKDAYDDIVTTASIAGDKVAGAVHIKEMGGSMRPTVYSGR